MIDTKIIYIQDDRSSGTAVQFCYSKDMQMIDNWFDAAYGENHEKVFNKRWEQGPSKVIGIRNLNTTGLSVEDFISMCNTLDYVVKRIKNEVTKGNDFKASCLKAYPEDFR